MATEQKPKLLYFTLEERNKGKALIAKTCLMVRCAYALGYVTDRGLVLSGKHEQKADVHTAPLTPEDLRTLANLIEELQANGDTMAGNDERRDAA